MQDIYFIPKICIICVGHLSTLGGDFINNFVEKYIKNKYKLLQLIGILITLPYILVVLSHAPATLFWFTTFPGWTLFFIGVMLDYLSDRKNQKNK